MNPTIILILSAVFKVSSHNEEVGLPFRKMWKQFGIFFLSIFFNLTLLPTLIIILSPFLLFRALVKKCAEWLAPNLEKILDPVTSLVGGGDDVYKTQEKSGLIAVTLSGRIDVDQVSDSFLEKVINSRFPNGEFRHPQFQQCMRQWMGFLFWETEKNFDVRTHVEVWSLESPSVVVTQEIFKNILNTILKTEFEKEQSPWKLYIVNNTRVSSDPPGVGNKTSLIFHFHHVLGGGVEVMNERVFHSWFDSNSNQTDPDNNENETEKESKTKFHCHKSINWRRILKYTKIVIFGSYELLSTFINQPEWIEWNSKTVRDRRQGDLVLNISEPLPTTVIKDIRSIYGTSFVSIILGAYAGALRRFMIQHLIKPPSQMKCYIQMEKNGNDSDPNLTVNLPIGNDLDPPSPKERILMIQRRLLGASKSTLPKTNAWCEAALGSLPNYAVGKINNWRRAKYVGIGTSLISVSSPIEKQILCNTEVVGLLPLERSPPSLQGPTLLCHSYGGSVQFILFGDSSILPSSSLPLKDLNTFIFKELNDLIRLDAVLYV